MGWLPSQHHFPLSVPSVGPALLNAHCSRGWSVVHVYFFHWCTTAFPSHNNPRSFDKQFTIAWWYYILRQWTQLGQCPVDAQYFYRSPSAACSVLGGHRKLRLTASSTPFTFSSSPRKEDLKFKPWTKIHILPLHFFLDPKAVNNTYLQKSPT